jgi:hypothetical protein
LAVGGGAFFDFEPFPHFLPAFFEQLALKLL